MTTVVQVKLFCNHLCTTVFAQWSLIVEVCFVAHKPCFAIELYNLAALNANCRDGVCAGMLCEAPNE